MNRTIKELAKKNGRVYVYLKDKVVGDIFINQAKVEGFTFEDGVLPNDSKRGYETIMAVNHNGTLNYVGTSGRIAFGGGFKKIGDEKLIRVDYEKYITGDKNYIYNSSN